MNRDSSGTSPNSNNPAGVSRSRMTRRQFLARGTSALFGAGLLTGGYVWQGEPNWLEVTELELQLRQLPPAFAGTRLVHFSDVHLGFNKDAGDVKRLVKHIKEARPDMICFTGDIVDSDAEDLNDSVALLAELTAPLGKYAIFGNHDYKNTELLTRLLQSAGFVVLRNQSYVISRGGERIAVAGLEDMLKGNPDPAAALKDVPADMFTVLLMHEPDYADTAEGYPFNLQLSGHSHGGQIRLPLVGAPYTPYGSTKYISGLYYTAAKAMPVYVNRGFGETYMPLRLLCRPELTVFSLRRA
ncbi:metallophosphoesterase [Paenibacillus sp. FSL R7-0331]|uniref:metallophosphoesterase n=1 Tax=Paenibacillus sp. FSL R7-0331 TaxID=1536773 RepID=UPI0004F729EE|nr:metallophosphoesterase [Paenibacillus sp. FSL R7-0331]AIQ54641.1 phosphoesterase [Paenibacillus sp. FSL R7-0331]